MTSSIERCVNCATVVPDDGDCPGSYEAPAYGGVHVVLEPTPPLVPTAGLVTAVTREAETVEEFGAVAVTSYEEQHGVLTIRTLDHFRRDPQDVEQEGGELEYAPTDVQLVEREHLIAGVARGLGVSEDEARVWLGDIIFGEG